LTPPLLVESFGIKYFPRNWGTVLIGRSLMVLISQGLFGIFYDIELEEEHRICRGMHCFSASFVISTLLTIVSLVLLIGYIYVNREKDVKADDTKEKAEKTS